MRKRAQPPLMAAVLFASVVPAGMSLMVMPAVVAAGRILHICKASVKELFYCPVLNGKNIFACHMPMNF